MSWIFVDEEKGVEVSLKWSELEGVMKRVTVFASNYPVTTTYGVTLSEFDFDDVERNAVERRTTSLSIDIDWLRTVEVVTMVFDYLDRKGIALKVTCYDRSGHGIYRRSSSEESVLAWERAMEGRSWSRRDENVRISALERSYLETRRRSRERRNCERQRGNDGGEGRSEEVGGVENVSEEVITTAGSTGTLRSVGEGRSGEER